MIFSPIIEFHLVISWYVTETVSFEILIYFNDNITVVRQLNQIKYMCKGLKTEMCSVVIYNTTLAVSIHEM